MSIELRPIQSTHDFYAELLPKYNTPAIRKRIVSRDIRVMKDWIKDIEQALSREDSSKGWFLGDKYYPHHLAHYKKELAALESIRADIK